MMSWWSLKPPTWKLPLHGQHGQPDWLMSPMTCTQAFLSSKFVTRSHNNDRLDTRNAYTLPKVPETKTPTLDGFTRSEAPPQAKTLDSQLQRLQFFVLDAVAPLTSIVEANAKGEKVDHRQAVNAAKSAIELVGNASAQISHYRRTRLVASLNKTLLPLVDDDKNFQGAAPSLFGSSFAKQSKDLVDQVKAMRSLTKEHKFSNIFFLSVPGPSGRGVGITNEEATTPGEEDTQASWDRVPTNTNPSGTSKLNTHRQFE